MLKTSELLERLDLIEREQYKDMLSQVNIPDFYKCIAQFSGLPISKVNDDTIASYLITWAKNKYRFYKMLGNSLRLDQKFKYMRQDKNLRADFELLGKEFPAYYYWLRSFNDVTKNKINVADLGWQARDVLNELHFNVDGSLLTHFFKSKLSAPDTLVTKLGRLFENDEIEAFHTISINPVDMMLASENPYNWNSCYRLELDRSDSHADGCLAAILDTTSVITYVWETEGSYDLYGSHKFKSIRYYRMRGWVNISDDFGILHFAGVYPGRNSYDEAFLKQLREVVEKVVSEYTNIPNKWRKNDLVETRWGTYSHKRYLIHIHRQSYYGYNEFDSERLFLNTSLYPKVEEDKTYDEAEYEKNKINILTYNEPITCPCGCGSILMGSDEVGCDDCDEGWIYNGEGFRCDNFYENEPEYKWCEYRDDYCTCGCMEYDGCDWECPIYRDNHPVCSLDENYECEDPDFDEVDDGVMQACKGNCKQCWRWKQHHQAQQEEQQNEE